MLGEPQSAALILALPCGAMLMALRRRWLNWSCLGAYVVTFLVMDYMIVILNCLGVEFSTIEILQVSDDTKLRALGILHLGIVSFAGGVALVDYACGAPRVYRNGCILPVHAKSALGIGVPRLFWLGAIYAVVFLALTGASLLTMLNYLRMFDVTGLYDYRMESNYARLYTSVAYNLLPYVGLSGLLVYFKRPGPGSVLFLLLFLLAIAGKVIHFHKEPLIIFASQCLVIYFILHAPSASKPRHSSQARRVAALALSAGTVFMLLCLLVWATHDVSDVGTPVEKTQLVIQMASERILGRVGQAYFFVAELVPERYPFYGLRNCEPAAWLLGQEFQRVNNDFFLIRDHAADPRGSISMDAIANHFGGFGYPGLVLGSLLQGILVAGIDRWLSTKPPTLGWLATLTFMMSFAVYLTETTFHGALWGFGGLLFIAHALLLNTDRPPGPVSVPPRRRPLHTLADARPHRSTSSSVVTAVIPGIRPHDRR